MIFSTFCRPEQISTKHGGTIRFTHAAAITDDDPFHDEVRESWMGSSNSGEYDGLGPFVTASGFSVQVAEAMAVSGDGWAPWEGELDD